MKWIVAVVCLFVGGFCVFGFMATFETGASNAIAFRIGYAVIGFASLVGMAFPFIPWKAS